MSKDQRCCISCRKLAPKSEFWRVVRCYPSRQIEIDLDRRIIQGRSAYLCPIASCLQLAQKKNRLGKSLKAPVPESIYQRLGILLEDV